MNRTLTELGSKIVSLIFVYPPPPPLPPPPLWNTLPFYFAFSPCSWKVLQHGIYFRFSSTQKDMQNVEIFSKFRVFVENVLCLQCRCKLRYRKVPKVTLRTTLGLSGLLLPPDPIAPFGRLLVYGDRYFRVAKTCLVYCTWAVQSYGITRELKQRRRRP